MLLTASAEAACEIRKTPISTYPVLTIDDRQFEAIKQTKKEDYIYRVYLHLNDRKQEKDKTTSNPDETYSFIRKQIDQGEVFGFSTEKDCYEYICLISDYPELENSPLPEQVLQILNNQEYTNSKKISNTRVILQTQKQHDNQ